MAARFRNSPKDSRKVEVRRTRGRGRGVFARRAIRRGELIAVFDGPPLDDDFDGWNDDLLHHAIQVGPKLWRDSRGLARLINHSCDPNCGIKRLNRIVAMRPIAPGEEITWDYEMTEKSDWFRMKCRCGSPLCRGRIGHYRNMPRHVRRKYRGFISGWIVGKRRGTPRA